MSVPPKVSPFQYNSPIADKNGMVTQSWQQQLNGLLQRVEGPVSSTAPASSSAAGTPLSLATDGSFLYVNLGNGTWKRITLVAF